jgi:heparosan-N-sulfate-glucuronate 5-epimerase
LEIQKEVNKVDLFEASIPLLREIYLKMLEYLRIRDRVPHVDNSGVPIVLYRDVGPQRNPVTVSTFALKYYNEAKDKVNKQLFLNCANWLVDSLSDKAGFSVWEYTFPEPTYNLPSPWVSGMAQGLGIEVLALAHKTSLDEKYMEAALRALDAFLFSVEERGVLCVDEKDGGWWYEEYASPDSIRSYVLNGHIFALEGVHMFYSYTQDSIALKIFDKGCQEVRRHLHEYDTGSWTTYDRLGRFAGLKYHNIHIKQMNFLWRTTQDPFFLRYYKKWKSYLTRPFSRAHAQILNSAASRIFAC